MILEAGGKTMITKQSWRTVGRIGALAVMLGLAFAGVVWSQGGRDQIKVGFMAPMTGDAAALGEDMANGWKLFWKQRGTNIAGREVVRLYQDDTGNPANALTKAQRFVNHDKVDLVVGTMHTNVGAAVAEFMARTEVPFIGPTFTLDDHTQRKPIPGVMRIGGFTSSQNTHAMGDWAYKRGYRKVVTLCQDCVYGQEGCGGFTRVFTDMGGQVVKQLWAPLGTQDYSPYISQIIEAKPNALFVITVGGDVARFARAAGDFELHKKVPIIGADNLTDQTVLRTLDLSDLGIITVGHFAEGREAPATQKFVGDYVKEYGHLPSRYSSNVYTTAMWVAKALEEVKSDLSNRKPFLEALKRVKIDNTPQGPVSLDSYANPVFNVYVRKVTRRPDGKLWNVPIHTYENVSQFWTYSPKEFLSKPVYSRNYQGDKVSR